MSIKLAVIGGSGIYKLDAIKLIREHEVKTPFGEPSSKVMEMEVGGASFYFLPRHGIGH